MSENLIGATTAIFPIRLSVAVASPVDVEWATRDGSAIAGSDYKAASGTVTFLPGETEKQIEVQVYGQAITPADDKVFFIRLNPPSNAVLVDAILTCTINIIDDQGIPSVAVVVAEGRRGPKGDPGLSAYDQAVLMGYTGTLPEWMDQIADASKAADRAEDYAISAGEDALKAQNAAKNAVFAGVIFPTASEGVDPVLGVKNGAYFNVRSPLSEHYIDEYQNVNGVAVATGKSYPTSEHLQNISDHTALPFVPGESYALNRRVQLDNGDIVKSTIDGNTNDPNTDMTGWKKPQASEIFDETGLSQQAINRGVNTIADLLAIPNPKNGSRVYVKGYREATNFALAKPYKGGGEVIYVEENSSINNGITIFNGWTRLGITDNVTPEMAGAYENDVSSDADAFDIAIQYAHANNLQVHALGATYYIDREVNVLTGKSYGTQGTIIKGAGKAKTFIRIAKDVDCFNLTNIDQLSFATNVRITDLSFKQTGAALNTGIALKTNTNLTNVILDEISFFECKQATKFPNQFYIARLTSLHAHGCTYGFELGLEGTTLFLDNLFVTGGGGATDSFGYKIRASYTTIGSLACDYFDGAFYDLAWGQYSIGALGLEGLKSRPSKPAISIYKANFNITNIELVAVNALLSSDTIINFGDSYGSIGSIDTINSNATSPAKLINSFNSKVEIKHLTGTTTYAKPTYIDQGNDWGVSINGFKYQRGDMRPQIGLANNSLVDNIVSKANPCKQSLIFDIHGAHFNSSGYTGEQDWQWLPAPSLGDWGIQRRPDLFGIAATVSLASGGICRDRTDAQKGTLPLIVYAKPSTPATGCIYIDKTTKKVEIFITDSWVLLN